LIHRDLKPGNLLLSSNDDNAVLKITDFTFARFVEPGNLLTTLVGTPLYMAPEIFLEKQYTEKGDLWSVGVILYQMLTGTQPFKAESVIELVTNIQRSEMSWPAGFTVSPNVKDLVTNLLVKTPQLRMSWAEFFMHPCLQIPEPVIESNIDSNYKNASEGMMISALSEAQLKIVELEKKLETAQEKLDEEKNTHLETKELLKQSEEQLMNLELKRKEECVALQLRVQEAESNSDRYAQLLAWEQRQKASLKEQLDMQQKKWLVSKNILKQRHKEKDVHGT